jgi:hypothetical protein
MTPQKATLDSMHTLSLFVSYRRLSSQFQFQYAVSAAVALGISISMGMANGYAMLAGAAGVHLLLGEAATSCFPQNWC